MTERDRSRQAREAVRAAQPELFAAISAALYRDDPMGIAKRAPENEYDPEVGTILPRLAECRSAEDVAKVVQEEMAEWFAGAKAGGPVERYARVAEEIWRLWRESLSRSGSER